MKVAPCGSPTTAILNPGGASSKLAPGHHGSAFAAVASASSTPKVTLQHAAGRVGWSSGSVDACDDVLEPGGLLSLASPARANVGVVASEMVPQPGSVHASTPPPSCMVFQPDTEP